MAHESSLYDSTLAILLDECSKGSQLATPRCQNDDSQFGEKRYIWDHKHVLSDFSFVGRAGDNYINCMEFQIENQGIVRLEKRQEIQA